MADTASLHEDDFLLAGELSLGVLEGEELSTARRLQLSDTAFAAAVEWWDERLARMAEADLALVPSGDVLRGIHATLDRIEGEGDTAQITFEQPGRRPAGWSIGLAALGTAMAAAALVLFLSTPETITQPPLVEQPAEGPQLVAQLADENSGRRLASVIDPARGRLSVNASGLSPEAGQIAELWVIPADGVPRSLGEIPGQGSFTRDLDASEASLIAAGASLAVTFEQDEGIRHQEPSPPILLVGQLDEV